MLHIEPTPLTTESTQQPMSVKSGPSWLRLTQRLFTAKLVLSRVPSLNFGTAFGFILAFALLFSGHALFGTFLGLAAMGLHTVTQIMREQFSKFRDEVREQIKDAPVTASEKPAIQDATIMKLVDAIPLLADNPAFQLLSTKKAFLIYADGSCQDHVVWKPSAWATLTIADGEMLERSDMMLCSTAQEAEAMSILEAVRVLPKGAGAVVINDCQMVIQALNGATPFLEKNTSRIVKGTKALVAQRRLNIKFIWMTETTPEHQQVHKLAKQTAKAGL